MRLLSGMAEMAAMAVMIEIVMVVIEVIAVKSPSEPSTHGLLGSNNPRLLHTSGRLRVRLLDATH